MSAYYYDTEFLEGTQTKRFLGIPFGKTKPTIDLISIGIVSEDIDAFSKRIGKTDRTFKGREYYAISKDFNLKEAWNRFDLQDGKKVYWIRDNVLKLIWVDLFQIHGKFTKGQAYVAWGEMSNLFKYRYLFFLIKKYGKSNKQIAAEIVEFVYGKEGDNLTGLSQLETSKKYEFNDKSKNPIFHAYYGAYDHVAFCWLFGKMIDLPKGFPMYSVDLKQMLDEKAMQMTSIEATALSCPSCKHDVYDFLEKTTNGSYKIGVLKEYHPNYPKQENAHNALDDARWNKKLHEFIKSQL